MEIKTQITKADLVEFQLFHSLRSVGSRLRFFSLALLPPVVPSAALYAITAGHLSRPVRLSFLLSIPLYFGLFYFLARRRLAKKLEHSISSKPNSELGDHVVDVEEQGIRLNQGSKDRFLNWKEIPRVIVNSGYGYIYTSADQAIIVPERCFTDGNAFALFMKVAVIYHWNAQRSETEQSDAMAAAPVEATTQQTGTSPMPALESQAPIAFVSRG